LEVVVLDGMLLEVEVGTVEARAVVQLLVASKEQEAAARTT
jgi:hypothetical protein